MGRLATRSAAATSATSVGMGSGRSTTTGSNAVRGHLLREEVLAVGDTDGTLAPLDGLLRGGIRRAGHHVGRLGFNSPARDRPEHGGQVGFLESVAPARVRGDLTEQRKERRGVLVRRMNPDGQIARADRPGAGAGGRPAGEIGVGLRHECRAAFVPGGDHPDSRLVPQLVEDGQEALTGDREDVVDPGSDERPDHRAGGGLRRWLHEWAA